MFKKKASQSRREVVARRRNNASRYVQVNSQEVAGRYRRNYSQSIYMEKPEEASRRQSSHTLRRRRKNTAYWLSATLIVGAGAWLISLQTVLSISVASSELDKSSKSIYYSDLLNEYYKQRPIERLRFLTNKSALFAHISARAPEVRGVRVIGSSKPFQGTLQLSFRQPVARWSSGGQGLYVDAQGVIFKRNFFAEPSISIKDKSEVSSQPGQEAANRKFLEFVGQVISLMGDEGLLVQEVVIPRSTLRQVEIVLEGRSYSVKMTTDRTAQSQVGEVVRAIGHIERRGLAPGYIDVRVDQRVYYK